MTFDKGFNTVSGIYVQTIIRYNWKLSSDNKRTQRDS